MPITINGSGTITGISAGGYPDDSVTADDLADGTLKVKAVTTKVQSFASNIITTSGSYTDTGIFINHTPTSTIKALSGVSALNLALLMVLILTTFYRLRDGSNQNISSQQFVFRVQTGNGALHLSITDIWEPNSTSQQTIKLFAAQSGGTSTQLVSPVIMSVFGRIMIDNVDTAEALYVLRPGAKWCLREGGYAEIVWLDDSDPPTEAEINAKAQELIELKPWKELRIA